MAKRTKKKREWVDNQKLIHDAYLNYINNLENKGKAPTLIQLAEITGLSMKTIERHIKLIEFKPQEHVSKVLLDDVIAKLAERAMSGSYKHMDLYLKIIGGWTEKTEIKQTTEMEIDFTNVEKLSSEMLEKIASAQPTK